MASMRIDRQRLLARLAELAEVNPLTGEGSCRLALTDEDRAGRDLLLAWMTDLGLDVRIDAIGNIFGIRPGADPGDPADPADPTAAPVMCGSHIDTVATGGRYDGALGVLAGLEVLETLTAAGVTARRPLAVAAFTNEEGSRFAPDMMGSLVHVGGLALEAALGTVGIDGLTVGAELARIGYQGPWPVPGPPPHAFVELHIEQGPVLENVGVDIGVVTGVQGISWQELRFVGQSNHAGTTPMALRRDPALAAARTAAFARELALELGGHQVATVGRMVLEPNLVNVIPARATLTVDLRNTDEDTLRLAEKRLAEHTAAVAAAEGVELSTSTLARFEPVAFDPRLVDLVEATARAQGHSTLRLPSGAGHDAQMLARVCPTAMIFVPSARGISHNPEEFTAPQHLEAGANVLLEVMMELAR